MLAGAHKLCISEHITINETLFVTKISSIKYTLNRHTSAGGTQHFTSDFLFLDSDGMAFKALDNQQEHECKLAEKEEAAGGEADQEGDGHHQKDDVVVTKKEKCQQETIQFNKDEYIIGTKIGLNANEDVVYI